MDRLKIIHQRPAALRPRATNPRTHSKKQIRQIADSIERFGFTNPVLVDRTGGIVAGHGRIEAAKLLGIEKVPTIRLEDLTEAEIRAYVIADNRLAENAGWDHELLAIELQGLIELDIDVTITGFEMPEIDILIGELEVAEEDDPANEVPEVEDGPPVSRNGDLWHLGRHRLLCGDALDSDTYARLLDGTQAHRFHEMVMRNGGKTIAEIAEEAGVGGSYFTRILQLSFLAPDVVKTILRDRHPIELNAKKLAGDTRLPIVWEEQRARLGIA
jgi:hypothetical protein